MAAGTIGPEIAADFTRSLPGLRWGELESHGCVVVDVAPDAIAPQWWFVDTVLERTEAERCGQDSVVRSGDPRVLQPVATMSTAG